MLTDGEQNVGMTVTYRYPPTLTANVLAPKVTLRVMGNVDSSWKRYTSINLIHSSFVDVVPEAPLCWDATVGVIVDLQRLFTLLANTQVFVRRLRGRITDNRVDSVTPPERQDPTSVWCEVILNQSELRSSKELMSHQMIMPYSALAELFPPALQRWFELLPKLRPFFDVFFTTYKSTGLFSESHFLTVMQAVESYHRRMMGGQYLTEAEYKPVCDALVAAIPPSVPSELRSKFKMGTLFYANEYSLGRRVKELLRALSPDELNLICNNIANFAKAVVDTRNNLTHVLGSPVVDSNAVVLEGRRLRHATDKLELLLVIVLLKDLGIPGSLVLARIKDCNRVNLEPFLA
jgi:hypothetical protein